MDHDTRLLFHDTPDSPDNRCHLNNRFALDWDADGATGTLDLACKISGARQHDIVDRNIEPYEALSGRVRCCHRHHVAHTDPDTVGLCTPSRSGTPSRLCILSLLNLYFILYSILSMVVLLCDIIVPLTMRSVGSSGQRTEV